MAIKKKEKTKAVVEEISLVQIAEEMNNVMQYGLDPETGIVDETQLVDVELSDKALQKKILELAQEDLRHSDQEAFSPEAWEWFINNGINPTDGEVVDEGDTGEVEEVEDDGGEVVDEGDENVSAKNPVKEKGKKEKPIKKQTAPEKRVPKERTPSNEQIAIEMVKEGKTEKDLLKKYTELYTARGKDDPDYIAKRTNIYWQIACKELGITSKPVKEKSAKKEEAVKEEEAKEALAKEKPKGTLKKK